MNPPPRPPPHTHFLLNDKEYQGSECLMELMEFGVFNGIPQLAFFLVL